MLRLKDPLGKWLVSGEDTHWAWSTYLDDDSDLVYLCKDDEYECYTVTDTMLDYIGMCESHLPPHAIPVNVDFGSDRIQGLALIQTRPDLHNFIISCSVIGLKFKVSLCATIACCTMYCYCCFASLHY